MRFSLNFFSTKVRAQLCDDGRVDVIERRVLVARLKMQLVDDLPRAESRLARSSACVAS
jgi:hypothetical protein